MGAVPPRSTGKQRLLLELGRGGMGTVYLAVVQGPAGFTKLKVVKQLNPRLASEPQFLTMFLAEARLSGLLNHPNIVQTNEVGFDGRDYFIEMEYLEGQPYDALIRKGAWGGNDERATSETGSAVRGLDRAGHLWILTQMLAGLHYAHELRSREGASLGVVHRDVSPHNVLITYEGTVKLLDFGIAKAAGNDLTRSGVIKGKARYMAPEQAVRRKRVVDRRADVFSTGIMLWEALAGRRFWLDMDEASIFHALESGDFGAGRTFPYGFGQELDETCRRALAYEPDERFPTAAAFQEALEHHLEVIDARVGSRPLGKLVTKLFEEERAALEEEVQIRLRTADGPVTAVRSGQKRDAPLQVPDAATALTDVTVPTNRIEDAGAATPGGTEEADASGGTQTSPAVTSSRPLQPTRAPTRYAAYGALAFILAATAAFCVRQGRRADSTAAAADERGSAGASCDASDDCGLPASGAPLSPAKR